MNNLEKHAAKTKLAGGLAHMLMSGSDDAMMLCKVLDSTAAQAMELRKKIKMGKKLPSWAEYKVYKAGDALKSAMSSTFTMADHMPKITIGIRTMPSMSSPMHKTAADDKEEKSRKLKRLVSALVGGTAGGAAGGMAGITIPAFTAMGTYSPLNKGSYAISRLAERAIPYGAVGGGLLGAALGAKALSDKYGKEKYYSDKKRKEIIREALAKHGSAKKELKEIAKELHGASKKHKGQARRVGALANKMKTAGTATKTDPEKWEQAKADAKARMGGKHSARAMQLATKLYKERGGGYSGAKPTAKNNSLKKWGKQKWQWSGGEKKKKAAAKRDPRLERAGVSGYNKPKRTPGHPTKSHIVVAKEGDRVKTIRFGQQGVKTNQTAGQRKAFKSRHAKNISKGRMSAAYWADKAKWSPSKTKDKKNQKWVKGS